MSCSVRQGEATVRYASVEACSTLRWKFAKRATHRSVVVHASLCRRRPGVFLKHGTEACWFDFLKALTTLGKCKRQDTKVLVVVPQGFMTVQAKIVRGYTGEVLAELSCFGIFGL